MIDIKGILLLQDNRCIYCNVRFTRKILPTKDHVSAQSWGGRNVDMNIIMACRSCNSRRCNIPFRTYCKLLSPTQNRRIILHLCRRLIAQSDHWSVEGFTEFSDGLRFHDPTHWRYKHIQCWSTSARHDAKKNRLLPCTPNAIIKKVCDSPQLLCSCGA